VITAVLTSADVSELKLSSFLCLNAEICLGGSYGAWTEMVFSSIVHEQVIKACNISDFVILDFV
jgi:hypothetical protein